MVETERVHEEVRIEYPTDSGIACIIMERGEGSMNVFTSSKVEAMTVALKEIRETIDCSCLVLYGEKEFSVGADLRTIQEASVRSEQINEIAAASNEFIRRLRDFPAPVIAGVTRIAAGGGLGFALACDLIAIHEEAALDTAYSRVGLTPDNGTPYFLTKTVGPYKARDLLFNPEPITATEALELEIATWCCSGPESEFLECVLKQAVTLAAGPTEAYTETKKLVDTALEEQLNDHLERERETIAKIGDSETVDKGLAAFIEKRDPDWDWSPLDEQEQLKARSEDINAELKDLRTRIDRVEREAIEAFNEHMETIGDLLDYRNLTQIWLEY